MKNWEYQYGKCDGYVFQKALNEASNDGWELVSFSAIKPTNWVEIHYVFRKEIVK